MSRRRPEDDFDDDLRQIEAQLRLLTLRLTAAREREALRRRTVAAIPVTADPIDPIFEAGDRVSFTTFGFGQFQGTVDHTTIKRVHIRQDGSSATDPLRQRARHNVVLIAKHVRANPTNPAHVPSA
jgi:hypothetical protein